MSKALQKKISQEFKAEFEKIPGVCFVDYTGLTAEKFHEFRQTLHKQGLSCKVIKNKLFARQVPLDLKHVLKGPICAVYGETEDKVVESAGVLKDWLKQNKKNKITGAYLNGEIMTSEQFLQLVDIGTKEQVLSKLVSVIQMPMTNVARTINAVPQKLAAVLAAYEEKLKSSGES